MKPPKITIIGNLAQTRLFRIDEFSVAFPNGVVAKMERLHELRKCYAMIVPLTDDGNIILVNEFAAGLGSYTLKCVTGSIEDNETLAHAAHRELREEIGVDAHRLDVLHQLYTDPGHSDSSFYVLLATSLYMASGHGDEPLPLLQERWPLGDLEHLIGSGRIVDSRSLAALLLTLLHFQNTRNKAQT